MLRRYRFALRHRGAILASALISLAVAVVCPEAHGQPITLEHLSADDVLAIAGRLIDAARYDEAQVLLDRLAADNAGGIEREFLDAIIALSRNDRPRAERLLRAIIEQHPDLVRVRLELARTLFLEKKDEDADYHFRLAIARKPPPTVIANIARFREAIRARRAWRFNLTLGLAPDSNINSATNKERVDIFGLPFQLDPGSQARSGVGAIVAADASVRIWRGSGHPLYLGGYGRIVRYGDRRFDDIYIGGEAGPEFRLAGGRLRVAATGLDRWYGGRQLVSSLGGLLDYDKIVGGKWSLEASLSARHNAYALRSDIDGWDVEAAASANRALSASALGFGYASVQRSIAHDPGQSSWSARIGGGVLKEVVWGLRPQIAVEAARQVNDAPLALFKRTRRDWRLQASASIYKRDWNVAGFAPSLKVSYSRAISTIGLYEQKRWRGEIGVTKAF